MKKVRITDYPTEYFNLVEDDNQGWYIEGEIIEENEDNVIILHPDYNRVYFPKQLLERE